MKNFENMRIYGIFSSCMRPVLPCVEENLPRDNDLHENLINNNSEASWNPVAPPHTPFMLNTNNEISFENIDINNNQFGSDSNMNIDVNNFVPSQNKWPDLDEILEDATETNQPHQAAQTQTYEIQTIPPNPFEIAAQGFASLAYPPGVESVKPPRVRWTLELHDQFVEVVNQLGGSSKASPKDVLDLMNIQGLTLQNVKSHLQDLLLQKYRTARNREESSEGGSEQKSNQMEETPTIQPEIGDDIDVNEALRIQMEVQKQLHEQLEMQKSLQMRIDEQGKYLKMMIEQQKERNNESDSSKSSEFDKHDQNEDQTENDECDMSPMQQD